MCLRTCLLLHRNNDKYPKYVRKLVAIKAFGDFCVLATKVGARGWVHQCADLPASLSLNAGPHHCCATVLHAHAQGENPGEYILILCNAIGSPVDSKYIDVSKPGRWQPHHQT